MKLLAVESSAVSASCAVTEGGKLVAQCFANVGLTHSETLLTLLDDTLDAAQSTLSDMDAVAVSAGPGSFTGVRIGVATVKGLAFTHNISCVGVSTLEAIAYNFVQPGADDADGDIICAAMDARRNQVYNALFRVGEHVERLCEDRAIAVSELAEELAKYKGSRIILAGDGAELCRRLIGDSVENMRMAPVQLRYQTGAGVAAAAAKAVEEGRAVECDRLDPIYFRPSQAERELKKRQEQGQA